MTTDIVNILLFLAFISLGVGMWVDVYRFGARIRIAGGVGTSRLYLWYGGFLCVDGMNHLFRESLPLGYVAVVVAWATLICALYFEYRGLVTWKRDELDPSFRSFHASVRATEMGARAVAKEVRKLNRGDRGYRTG